MNLLVLIYAPFLIVAEPRDTREICLQDATDFIGTLLPGTDIAYGTREIPKVVLAFCVEGDLIQ